MKFRIKHEIRGRIRIHAPGRRMSIRDADILQYYLEQLPGVTKVQVYERTNDASICYTGERRELLKALSSYSQKMTTVPEDILEHSGRALNAQYKDKLIGKLVFRAVEKLVIPPLVRNCLVCCRSMKYLRQGLSCLRRGKLEVAALDATAIGVSVARRNFSTAGSVMFLLGIGEILEEWTHKKSVGDLARSMSLRVDRVWLRRNSQEILVPAASIQKGDTVVVHMGSVIPFDGEVTEGEAMVNQASLTGESAPVYKTVDGYVYAGTVVEEGELAILVKEATGSTKFEKIVTMIEESEKLKSGLESRAEHLADQLVPYTLAGTALTLLLTRNVTKALSVLMVDFSCALKLSMPIAVLSAIREASRRRITVKGGKYMEAVAEAATIVFDKTGTLTKARAVVREVIPFGEEKEAEMLRIAACLEEHFPHSVAKAVVRAARERNLEHQEMHTKVEYIVAHGIASTIEGKKAIIGSYHFVFEDEKCRVPEGEEEKFSLLPGEYSHLYLAINGQLSAVICIEDPLREETSEVISLLRKEGIARIVMMTGDSERTAASIAKRIGVDEYHAEVLPEGKAAFIEQEKAAGRKVLMVGDGINDSPALSAADAGIAISDGAELAREVADITIAADDLYELVTLKQLSNHLMTRIRRNYRMIVGINTALIFLGVGGWITPPTSAFLHNMSTLAISLEGMKNLLPESGT